MEFDVISVKAAIKRGIVSVVLERQDHHIAFDSGDRPTSSLGDGADGVDDLVASQIALERY